LKQRGERSFWFPHIRRSSSPSWSRTSEPRQRCNPPGSVH
jgi:hypothetical protein